MLLGTGWVNVARFVHRAGRGLMLALALTFGPGLVAEVSAQEATAKPAARAQRGGAKGKRARAKAAAAKPKSTPAAEKPVEEAAAPKPEREASAPSDAQAGGAGTGTGTDAAAAPGEVRTEGDTQVKVMEFSGLDIEGQLKTPQMLYFLNRLRAEFGRPKLPHRSFMPELQRGTQEQSQR